MGRSPCCEKVGLKKGPWTPEEDQRLLAFIDEHGHGSWRSLPSKAGLERCGKSCRLRWTNYLRPDIKRGKFSLQEEQTIIQLHALLGNRWSAIATHLPKRTDNEIKNYWNTHLKKRLAKMGIDPVTHKPKNDSLLSSDGQPKNAANLSHMAQWESARLEAEARLVRQSKQRSSSFNQLASLELAKNTAAPPPPCRDTLKAWNGAWNREIEAGRGSVSGESTTSTMSFSENGPPVAVAVIGEGLSAFVDFVGNSESCEGRLGNSMSFMESTEHVNSGIFTEKFTDLLLNNSVDRSSSVDGGSGEDYEDNKNYWDTLLHLVNSSPPNSPMF